MGLIYLRLKKFTTVQIILMGWGAGLGCYGAIGHTRGQGKTLGTPMQSYGKYDPIFKPYPYTVAHKYRTTCTIVSSKVLGIHRYPVWLERIWAVIDRKCPTFLGVLDVFPHNFFEKSKLKILPHNSACITSLKMSVKGYKNQITFRYQTLSQNLIVMYS